MSPSERRAVVKALLEAVSRVDQARETLSAKGTGYGDGSQQWIRRLRECAETLELVGKQVLEGRS